MDIIGKNRTFLVIFGLLVLFVIIIMQCWKSKVESFSNLQDSYPDGHNMGNWINIDGRSKIADKNPSKRYEGGHALSNRTNNENACVEKCERQPECNPLEKNECNSTFYPDDSRCYCKFRRIQENYQGLNDTIKYPEGFETVLETSERVIRQLPNAPVGEFSYPPTTTDCVQLQKDLGTYKWEDLKITSRNAMSISFWIYFDEAILMTQWHYWISILQIMTKQYADGGGSWYGNDRFIGIWLRENAPVLHIRNIARKGDSIEPNDGAPDEIRNNRIGFDPRPSWMTITYDNGRMKIFKNGECINRHEHQYGRYVTPPNDAVLVLNREDKKGIYMHSLQFYNRVISEKDVKDIYTAIENKCPSCWLNSINVTAQEGFFSGGSLLSSPLKFLSSSISGIKTTTTKAIESFSGQHRHAAPDTGAGIDDKFCHKKMYPYTGNASNMMQSDPGVIKAFRQLISQHDFNYFYDLTRPTPLLADISIMKKIRREGKQCGAHGKNAGRAHNSGNQEKYPADNQIKNKMNSDKLLHHDQATIEIRGRKRDFKNELNALLQSGNITDETAFMFRSGDKINISCAHGTYPWVELGNFTYKGEDYQNASVNVKRSVEYIHKRDKGIFAVNNTNMGGDPYAGVRKYLRLKYRSGSRTSSTTIPEGTNANIPENATIEDAYYGLESQNLNNIQRLVDKIRAELKAANDDNNVVPSNIASDGQLCSIYTSHVQWGKASTQLKAEYDLTATVPLRYCDKNRTLKYHQLIGEEYFDIASPLTYDYTNGCTFGMWFKIDKSINDSIQPSYKKNWWKRLVNFGLPREWYLNNEVVIAIRGDETHQTMDFLISGDHLQGNKWRHTAYTIRQVMDGNWHHIIWSMHPGGKTIENGIEMEKPPSWSFYHNGDKMWSSSNVGGGEAALPFNTSGLPVDFRQHVGGPSCFWDPFFQPAIGEFQIINKAVTDEEAWTMYIKPA
jgi:hypothetical protein